MSAQGLETIDETVQQTHIWLNELAEATGTQDKRRTLRRLRGALHALRDSLPHDETAHLSAQLPTLVRGIYWEGWQPSHTPTKDRGADAFVARVGEVFGDLETRPGADDIRSVFELLGWQVSAGEIRDAHQCLPADVQRIRPEAA